MSRIRTTTAAIATLALAAVIATGSAWASETVTVDATTLEIHNLIGQIDVTADSGSAFEVTVDFQGKDAASHSPKLVRDKSRDSEQLTIQFPESNRFVYPALGKGSNTRFRPDSGSDGWLANVMSQLFGKDIKVSGSGSGLEVWADVQVRVPAGATLIVRHGVGRFEAVEVKANLDVEVRSGRVGAEDIDGNLAIETGSGHIHVRRADGEIKLSTGSGGIEASELRGAAASIATGSGSISLSEIDSPSLSVATGSGSVTARAVGTDRATIATGSGSVNLELVRMGNGSFEIGTGSGRVTLRVPDDASMDVHAETGSGGVDLDLDRELTMTRHDRDEVEFTVGGGAAKVRIGTGSGGVRIAKLER